MGNEQDPLAKQMKKGKNIFNNWIKRQRDIEGYDGQTGKNPGKFNETDN